MTAHNFMNSTVFGVHRPTTAIAHTTMSSEYMKEKETKQDVLDDDAVPSAAVQGQLATIDELEFAVDRYVMFLNPRSTHFFILSRSVLFVRFRVEENTKPGNNGDIFLLHRHFFYQMDQDD